MEPIDVRLARIEEGLVSLHGKIEDRHQEIMKAIKPLVEKVEEDHLDIVLMKRDKKWIYGILVFIGTGLSYLIKTLFKA